MIKHIHQTKTAHRDEQGFASIVIALVLIIVLGLLTVGFAQLARREQQSTLDKQLSSQAYDAAESGVNDAYHDITTGPTPTSLPYINPTNVPSPSTCITPTSMPLLSPSSDTYNTYTQSISTQDGVSFTCLLVNLQPPNLLYDNVFPDTSRSIVFSTSSSDPTLNTLTFTWNSADSKTFIPPFPTGSGGLPPTGTAPGDWKSPAMLQVSITPLPSGGINRNSLQNNTFTAYLYPSGSSTPIYYAPNSTAPQSQGLLVPSACTVGTGQCSGTITGLGASPGAAAGVSYILHVLDYYDESQSIVINGQDIHGGPVTFLGQDQIDVTGKAHYVLKRLQERVQPSSLPTLPEYAVEGQNICKRFSTYPAATTPDTTFPTLVECSSFD
jgi:hypothetical protein